MDIQNAFVGSKTPPTEKEVAEALRETGSLWKELIDWLAGQSIVAKEWKSPSPKFGWGLRPALKKRTILYLGPCEGCFRVAFVLGDRAVAAARSSDLPKSVLKQIAAARRYAEGTGIRLFVRKPADLAPIRKLVEIKLSN
ncbi:MAG: DUF3788 domain-containing protein [Terracidiphilus sp.]